MDERLISIIIPVFNAEKYLEACLKSVISQTYTKIEIIIIDDGSTDRSYLIYNKYKKMDSRLIIIKKENGGLSDARNYGLKNASGDYVFFLDSDDIIQENTIEILYKVLYNYDSNAISFCTFERFTSNPKYISFNNIIYEYSSKEYFESIMKLQNNTYACGVLIPKTIIENDIFIKDRYFEDMASMYKIYAQCNKIIKVDCQLYKYRTNPNSIVHTANIKKSEDYYLSAIEMTSFIREKYDINDRTINTFMCYINRESYIMSKDKEFLLNAKELIKKTNLQGISLKNKIKLILLNNLTISKLIIKIKNI